MKHKQRLLAALISAMLVMPTLVSCNGTDTPTEGTADIAVTGSTQDTADTAASVETKTEEELISVNHKEQFANSKYGLFVHFVHGASGFSDGTLPADVNETVNSFDVVGFADDVEAMGVQYLIFTAWHWQANPPYPSEVHGKYRSSDVPERDLIGEIIDEITSRGIQMLLYTHPRDGHDFIPEDQISTGWSDGTVERDDDPDMNVFNYELWNTYMMEMYEEVTQRYGSRISGLWFDGLGPYYPTVNINYNETYTPVVDYVKIRSMLMDENPTAFTVLNYAGNAFNCDFSMWEAYSEYESLLAEGRPISTWPTRQMSAALQCFTHGWYPGSTPRGGDCTRMPVEEMIQFNFLQGSVSDQGGVAWATGPYCEGNEWGVNVLETLNTVGETLHRYEESFMNAQTSLSYPTISGDTLETKNFRFFMTSADEKTEYLHILKMPEDNSIVLEASQDGAVLANPVSETDGVKVESFTYAADGTATLVLSGTPDPVNTVIAFERQQEGVQRYVEWINNNDSRIVYVDNGGRSRSPFGTIWWLYRDENEMNGPVKTEDHHSAIEADWTMTTSAGCSVFLAFEGAGIELYGATGKNYGIADVYIDHHYVGTIDESAENAEVRIPVFVSENLGSGWHTIELKTTGKGRFVIDAFKVIK